MRRPRRIRPVKTDTFYHAMWRIVDGAVRKTFAEHPEYLAPCARERTVRQSINKRVVGALSGYVGETSSRRRGSDPVK